MKPSKDPKEKSNQRRRIGTVIAVGWILFFVHVFDKQRACQDYFNYGLRSAPKYVTEANVGTPSNIVPPGATDKEVYAKALPIVRLKTSPDKNGTRFFEVTVLHEDGTFAILAYSICISDSELASLTLNGTFEGASQ